MEKQRIEKGTTVLIRATIVRDCPDTLPKSECGYVIQTSRGIAWVSPCDIVSSASTGLDNRVKQIKDLIDDYINNPENINLAKTALEIHRLYKKEIGIAEVIEGYWQSACSLADK